MNIDEIKRIEERYMMQTYKRASVVFERGEGCYVYDQQGKRYLDLFGGIATCSVGHANPEVAQAIAEQANKLTSVSNLYYTEPPVLLAKKLAELSGLKKCFLCHSGAESNEAAIKLAKKVTGKTGFIAFKDAFHGRTTGSLALTWNEKYKKPFLPLSPSVKFVDYDDLEVLKNAIDEDTAAIIVEPIQGEAGIVTPKTGFLKGIRELCDNRGILMIIDEVQTGTGRTGKFFAYQHEGITPDIVTVAKGLANGVPVGACLSNFELESGDHGSTLGGNSLSAAAALATIRYIEEHELMKNAEALGDYLMQTLSKLDPSRIDYVRGRGLMIGIVLKQDDSAEVAARALTAGLVCNAPAPNIIRLLPPLILTKEQAKEGVAILKEALK